MNIQIFKNKGHNIRVLGDAENPLFVAKDICDILGYSDAEALYRRLDDDEKVNLKEILKTDIHKIDHKSLGLRYDTMMLTESGMYSAILWSHKPEAKQFRKWVTSEVLPQIRKTGSYKKQLTPAEILVEQAKNLVEMERRLKEQEQTSRRLENNIRRTITDVEYFTVIGYANIKGIKAGTYHAPSIGRKAKKLSEKYGYKMGKLVDPKYGHINTYHVDILDEIFFSHKNVA